MITIKANENEYKIEYGFAAAENKDIVQKMFNIASGVYFTKAQSASNEMSMYLIGTSELVGDIAGICKSAFYVGFLENNPVSPEESNSIMKIYMKENNLNFLTLYQQIRQCMEDDGFFELSGINAMLSEISASVKKSTAKKKVVSMK